VKGLKAAVIGLSGSGKSTTAGLMEAFAVAKGGRTARLKLSAPLYALQTKVYEAAGVELPNGAQDQLLMEALATHLRRIKADSLVADFLRRMADVQVHLLINDDLRDPFVDAPKLREEGFRIVRVRCLEPIRQRRLGIRGDITVADSSTSDLDLIEPDAVIDNNSTLADLRQKVDQLMGDWL
jgi:dephospho-CoA kinase